METQNTAMEAETLEHSPDPSRSTAFTWQLGQGPLTYFAVDQAFVTLPPTVPEVVPGFFAGTVGMLVAPGGTGKSSWALLLALSVATGHDLVGMRSQSKDHQWVAGPVLFWSVQDPPAMLHRRIYGIGHWMQQQQGKVAGRAFQQEAAQHLKVVTNLPQKVVLNPDSPLGWTVLRQAVQAEALRFIIIDPLRSFHTGEENDSRAMSGLFKQFDTLARTTNTAVLVIHHTAKGRVGGQADTARGSGVLTNDVRWQAHLTDMDPKRCWMRANGRAVQSHEASRFICWHGAKQNYAAREPDQWYERVGDLLVPVALTAIKSAQSKRSGREEQGKEGGQRDPSERPSDL